MIIVHLEKAIRLNPIPQIYYWTFLGGAYRMAGQYEKAIICCKKAIQKSPDHSMTNLILTAAYCQAGMEKEARKTAQNVVRIMPSFSVENYSKIVPFKNKSELKRYIEALRKAGLWKMKIIMILCLLNKE